MTSEHTVSAFDHELNELAVRIAQMGGLAEKILTDAVHAFDRRDEDLAHAVIDGDVRIDELEAEVEEQAVLLIARRQPMASDLREVMAAIRIAADLERIGDLAKNVAKRSLAIHTEAWPHKGVPGLDHMARMALEQLKDVLDAYTRRDIDRAVDVWHRDTELDAIYTSIFREMLTYMMEDPRNITFSTHLLFAAKNIERIGDHSTNIAETIHYLISGRPLRGPRPKSDQSSLTSVELGDKPSNIGRD
ncbi:phosphate signaling complex protein PhoU [Lutibaculum baratangense]|uniref:Phosphate-specific transport system accessory protein PhoU n=1 Tax=Lutibaculum baratangense AMV1 TaxID=631454 RepID=V4RW36_9HYPH|nr:phosphate signaling complex protein PhoU [Lutibaculum baratangense]ESR27250.1 Phosphate transport system regulatory protein PhoU [Lutibaculum baratangense AMV1]